MAASETSRDHLTIQIEPALRRRIEARAALRGTSVREYVEETLTRAVAMDEPVADGRERNASPIHVPPMSEEERQRGLDAIERTRRMSAELFEKYGLFPDSTELIHQARKERTRQLMEASGMEWTEEDEAAWDDEK